MSQLSTVEQVLQYNAYDGSPFIQESTNGVVRYLDLTLPQFWLPRHHWVLCLEVIEHIPGSVVVKVHEIFDLKYFMKY